MRNRGLPTMTLSQKAYIDTLITRFAWMTLHQSPPHSNSGCSWCSPSTAQTQPYIAPYREIIDHSCTLPQHAPDIAFAVSTLAQFSQDPPRSTGKRPSA